MARRLSDVEWATFLSQVNVSQLNLPPWGGVVEWGGLDVLVYVGPSGEVFTTDISDSPQLLNVYQANRTYDPNSGVWWYNLPREVFQTVINDAITTGQILQTTLSVVSSTIGQTAGNILAPVVQPLTLPLVAAAIIAILVLRK